MKDFKTRLSKARMCQQRRKIYKSIFMTSKGKAFLKNVFKKTVLVFDFLKIDFELFAFLSKAYLKNYTIYFVPILNSVR